MLVGLRPVRGPSAPGCSRRAAQGPEPGDRPQAPARADVRRDRSRGRPHGGRGQDAFQARARGAARGVDREGDRAMTIRDREVLDELREDPELLALADAVVETQRIGRRYRPWGAVTIVALAAALFLLVLASPWDRGGERGSILDRALAAIPTGGPVSHLTIQLEQGGGHAFSPVTNEAFYDKRRGLARVVSRDAGETIADYTTRATEDEFTTFPGLLAGAEYYREALESGNATIVGQGVWRGRPVHWVRLEGRGGLGALQIGIDRDTYRPVVFRLLDARGRPSGFQVAVLDFEYVSSAEAAFQADAPVLVRGTVLGRDCRPTRARIGAVVKTSADDPVL